MRTILALFLLVLVGCASLPKAKATAPSGSNVAVQSSPAEAPTAPPAAPAPFPWQAFAIFTAIGIFLAREVLEHRRRGEAKDRKIAAIKAYIARQCEFNNYAIKTLRRTFSNIKELLTEGIDDQLGILFLKNGQLRLNFTHSDGNTSGTMIPYVRVAEFEARLIEVSELDGKFQELLDTAATASAEIAHVKDSFLSYVLKEDDKSATHEDPFFLSFLDYGLEQLDSSYDDLNSLYIYCTGKDKLSGTRLR